MNLSRPTKAFYFDDIKDDSNNQLLKDFVKYELGLAQRLSITSIYYEYNYSKDFLYCCDKNGTVFSTITKADFKGYIDFLYAKEVTATATNRAIKSLSRFISFLVFKELIAPTGFHFEYYRANETYRHNDISVFEEDINQVLSVLDKFPEHLRLMYLNLWCIGLHVNQVCSIKADAYTFDGTTSLLLIYQNKAKREKRVPIPYELYPLMTDYIFI